MIKRFKLITLVTIICCTMPVIPAASHAGDRVKSRAIRVTPHSGTVEKEAVPDSGQIKGIPVNDFELVVQRGHSGDVRTIATGPAGKFLVTGSADKTIKIWDLESGILLRTIPVYYEVSALAVDASGQLVYTANSENGDLFVYRLSDGQRMATYRGKREIYSLLLTPDGELLITGSGDGHIQIRDTGTGRPVKTISTGKMTGVYFQIYAMAISRDGRLLATTGLGGDIMLWRLPDGEFLETFKAHKRVVHALKISPEGRHLISAGSDNSIRIWEISSGRMIRVLEGHPVDKYSSIRSLAIDPTGKKLFSGDTRGNIFTWDLQSGDLIDSHQAHLKSVSDLTIDPSGRFLVSASKDYTLKVFEISTGRPSKQLTDHSFSMTAVAWHPTEKYLVAGGSDDAIRIWNLHAGRLYKTLTGHRGRIGALAVDPTGRYIISGSWDRTVRIWEFATGSLKSELHGHEGPIRTLRLSHNGEFIISGSDDRTIMLWRLSSGELVHSFSGHSGAISALCLDRSDRFLVSASWDRTLKIWDLVDRKLLKTIASGSTGGLGGAGANGHSAPVLAIAMEPRGRFFVTSAMDRTAKFWELTSGELLHTMRWNDIGVLIDMDPGRMRLISGSMDGSIRVWDIASEDTVAVLRNESAGQVIDSNQWVRFGFDGFDNMTAVNAVATSSDGNRILAANQSGSVILWDLLRNSHITLASAADQWVMFNPEGYFDASGNGGDLVPMVRGMRVYGIDQFALRNNRPDLILKKMGLGNEQLLDHLYGYYIRRLKKVGISPEQLSGEVHLPQARILESNQTDKQVHLLFEFSDKRLPLLKYNIYINNVPLYGIYGKDISGHSVVVDEMVELDAGRNKIEASCINSAGAEAFRSMAYFDYHHKVTGDLYFVGFGCSMYRDRRLNLRYAHKDVSDLADTFRKMDDAFDRIHVSTYINDQVTADAFRKVGNLLKEATVDDTVVLFVAGHGVHDMDPAVTYYYLTYDADLGKLGSTAIDFESIEKLLVDIAPRKKLFLIDTCESGELDEQRQQLYLAAAGEKGLLARTTRAVRVVPRRQYWHEQIDRDRYIYNELLRRSGAIVFSSSRGDEFSYESDRLQNGYFTEQLVRALTTDEADDDHDQMVSSDELRRFVSESVARMSHGLQHPTVDRDNIYQKIVFPIVD